MCVKVVFGVTVFVEAGVERISRRYNYIRPIINPILCDCISIPVYQITAEHLNLRALGLWSFSQFASLVL